MNTVVAQHSTFDARILALGRRFRAMDIDVDPSLMQLAKEALRRATGDDTGTIGQLRRQSSSRLTERQAAQVLNAFRQRIIESTPCEGQPPSQRRSRNRHHAPANALHEAAGECVHRWRIEEASEGRRRLPATCSTCGQARTFATSMPDPAEAR